MRKGWQAAVAGTRPRRQGDGDAGGDVGAVPVPSSGVVGVGSGDAGVVVVVRVGDGDVGDAVVGDGEVVVGSGVRVGVASVRVVGRRGAPLVPSGTVASGIGRTSR